MQDPLKLGQINTITFAMVNAGGIEVLGLTNTFTVLIAKGTQTHVPSAGLRFEIGHGQYAYMLMSEECDTVGPISLVVTAPGCVQQNLHYVVEGANAGALKFTYALTSTAGGAPIEAAQVWVTTDAAELNVIASDVTDSFGNAVFWLQPGTYYFWRAKDNFAFVNPDIEEVS